MGYKPITPAVMAYFTARPGSTLYLNDIAKDLNMAPRQVQQTINNINGRNRTAGTDIHIECITRGQVWRYIPKPRQAEPENPPQSKAVFAFVGNASDGSAILERDDGVLFKAVVL